MAMSYFTKVIKAMYENKIINCYDGANYELVNFTIWLYH